MTSTLQHLVKKLDIDLNQPSPIQIKFSRYQIIDVFHDLDFKVGAEIGTEHGKYAAMICAKNPQLKLFCVDSWMPDTYYHPGTKQAHMDALYEESKNRLASYNCEIIKMTSMEAVKKFKPNSFDFVFIDGNHNFEFIKEDIEHWSKVVKPGGIVYGHDYREDVQKAVDAFIATKNINPWFVMHRGGYMIPCWMFVREKDDLIVI